jgi:hypothetical protein
MQTGVKKIMSSAMREGKREAFAACLRLTIRSIAEKQVTMWIAAARDPLLPIMDDSVHLTRIHNDLCDIVTTLDTQALPDSFVIDGVYKILPFAIKTARKINDYEGTIDVPENEAFKNALLETLNEIREAAKHALLQWPERTADDPYPLLTAKQWLSSKRKGT